MCVAPLDTESDAYLIAGGNDGTGASNNTYTFSWSDQRAGWTLVADLPWPVDDPRFD